MFALFRNLTAAAGQFLRRRARFGLRTLLVAVTLLAVALGWLVSRVERQRRAVETIIERGGRVVYAHEIAHRQDLLMAGKLGSTSPPAPEPGPAWLRRWLSPHYFQSVELVYIPPERDASGEDWPLGDLASVKSVVLIGDHPRPEQLRSIGAARSLRELDLVGIELDEQGAAHLVNLHQLRRLDVSGGSITAEGLENLCRIPNLEELTIVETKVERGGFAQLPLLAKAHRLKVSHVDLRNEDLDQIAAMPSLKHVDLWWTAVTTEGIQRLENERPVLLVTFIEKERGEVGHK